jgi:hypothetical protein
VEIIDDAADKDDEMESWGDVHDGGAPAEDSDQDQGDDDGEQRDSDEE